MFDWIYTWLWNIPVGEVFTEKPIVIASDIESKNFLENNFKGAVIDFTNLTDDKLKEQLLDYSITRGVSKSPLNKTLIILDEPDNFPAIIYLQRLIEHQCSYQTWIMIVNANLNLRKVDKIVQKESIDGTRIVA